MRDYGGLFSTKSSILLAGGITDDENVEYLHQPCLSVIWRQEPGYRWAWIPAYAE